MDWKTDRYGDLEASVPEGMFWIGQANNTRSGMVESFFQDKDNVRRTELPRRRSVDKAKEACDKFLAQLRREHGSR